MTEERYHEFTNKLHQYIHSIDPGDPHRSAMIETFLQTQLRIIDCISKTDHPCILSEEIRLKEWAKFSKTLFVPTNNPSVYEDKLLHAVNRLTWCNLKHKINTSARTYTVGQGEIFYVNLGDNIGSEQNGRRPVLILQNNTGNRNGNTTLIAPITSHQKSPLKYDPAKKMYYIEKFQDNEIKRKYLGRYEVPLELEESTSELHGFINVMHLREIDRKRIDSRKIGIVTKQCFEKVIHAVIENLHPGY